MSEPIGNGLGFEAIGVATALTAAQGLSSIPTDGAGNQKRCIAMIQCAKSVDAGTLGNVAVRWRNDGTDPTANVGHELQPGDERMIGSGLSALKFIGVAANAKVNVTYFPWNPYAPYL